MKKKLALVGMLSIMLLFGLMVISCDTGSGSSGHNNDAAGLEGTWRGSIRGEVAIVTVSYSGWTLSVRGLNFTDTGSFNRIGNSAVLYSSNGTNVGTANMLSPYTAEIVLNSTSVAPGTYTLTKYL